jgi:hypothetical protein
MSVKRDHLWMVVALLVGFALGIYYSKNTGASLMLAGMAPPATGTNGTTSIPVYGMVTAAQGVADSGNN